MGLPTYKINSKAKQWLEAAGTRAIKTMAQTILAMLPAAASINEVDWKTILGTAILAAITSLMFSLKGLPELPDSPETQKEKEE